MISVYTATHDSKWLNELYESLKLQSYTDWEWIILYNNGAQPIQFSDSRVKGFLEWNAPKMIGPLKAAACAKATGEIFVEMDHDDLLMPNALEEVYKAFQDPEIGFVYSNLVHAQLNKEGPRYTKPALYDETHGWKYREIEWNGIKLNEFIAFDPYPDSVSRIWYAPDHIRAFRKSVYESIGGYAKDLRVLDDLDLICRMYLATKFLRIDKGLYIYRIHGENTWLKSDINAEIQDNVFTIYDKYIKQLTERWADINGLKKIELGKVTRQGFTCLDNNLNKKWPLADSSVGVIRAFDIFSKLKDPIHVIKELYRVLAPAGWAFIQVSSTDGRGAFQDSSNKSFWNQNSFLYFTNKIKAQQIGTPVRFQAPRLFTTEKNFDGECWVVAELVSLKNGYRPAGALNI
jgi:glycosyltransferase involved in cell wall biosynthesis